MRFFVIFFVAILFILSFAETLPPGNFSQNGFSFTDVSFIYRGVRYPMKRVTDGEFEIELGCRVDTGAVDIAFVIDNTGSMSGTIADVRSNINGLATELDARGYDYRFGGVCYGDAVGPDYDDCTWAPGFREAYDSTGAIADLQMTSDYWGSFQPWINSISAWGGCDGPENAICAIERVINSYYWRPDALHIIVFFTDACYYELGDICDGTCGYTDEQVYNDIIAGGFVLFSSTSEHPACSGCSSVDHYYDGVWPFGVDVYPSYDWYDSTSTHSGGNWYTLGTSYSIIFSDLVALIDTFEIISLCVTNNSGATINPGVGTLTPGACITPLSMNPQSYGPWTPGEEHCFVWRISSVDGCTGPDACFTATVDGGGFSDGVTGCIFLEDCACPGPEATPLCPPCTNPFTACDYQEITIQLRDDDSYVNTSTISLVIDGYAYNFPDHLSFAGDILTFTPTTPWIHGSTVTFELTGVEDGMGCPMLNTILCLFTVDLYPPDFTPFDPVCETELADTFLSITVDITDDVSGMDLLNLYFTVDGTPYYPSGANVNYAGDYYSGTLTLSGTFGEFGLHGEEDVEVCIYAQDRVLPNDGGCDLCGPNDTVFCCIYYMNTPPTAEFIIPDTGSIVACDPAEIFIVFHDSDGDAIDSMTLSLDVWPSSLPTPVHYDITHAWFNMVDETTAVFTPAPGFYPSGDTIWALLTAGQDIRGAEISNLPLMWSFVLDYDPPVFFNHFPPNDSVIYALPDSAYVVVFDSISGVDISGVTVEINSSSASFTYTDFSDGNYGLNIPLSEDLCLTAGESCTLEVCVYAPDMPDTCGPNDTTDCWIFVWVRGFPSAEIQFPTPYSIVACVDSTIEIILHGGVGEIDTNSILLTIDNGDGSAESYTIDHAWLYVDYTGPDTVLIFAPPLGYWLDHDTIQVSLDSLSDIYGFAALDLPLTWIFYTDFSPPVTFNHYPPDSSTVISYTTSIEFDITDSVAGLDADSFYVIVTDTSGTLWTIDTFTIYDSAVFWDGMHFIIDAGLSGLIFEDGDTVFVCVEPMLDTPTFCGPNDTVNCWWFVVSVNIPEISLIQYLPSSYVACEPETIIATIVDPDGVNISTLEFWVIIDGIDTTEYYGTDAYFTYDGESLWFSPPSGWGDSEVIDVCVAYVEDSLGNAMDEPYCWSFIIDKSAPALLDRFPADSSIFPDDWTGIFDGQFIDTLAGIDTNSFWVTLCEDTFYYPRAGISVSPGDSTGSLRFTIDPNVLDAAGDWRACTLVCMHLADMPDYCGPNEETYCWTYYLTPGPLAEIVTPFDGQITACDDQCILIHLWDEDLPLDMGSIILVINDDSLVWGDPRLAYSGDTLSYCPDSASLWENNEIVNVVLLSADDSVGAELQDTLRWSFSVDLESPLASSFSPGDGDTISFGTPPICFDLTDNLSGVNWDSLVIAIDGSVFVDTGSPAVEVIGASVCIYPESLGLRWVGGDSAVVCVHALDSPDLCVPNALDTCWRFYIMPGGPYGTIDHPYSNAWVSCPDTGIVMHILDDDGVVDTSIQISVYRTSSGVTDTIAVPAPTLSWDAVTGGLLYHPTTAFFGAETVIVCIIYAEDVIGNPLEPRPVCSEFHMDRFAPVLSSALPAAGSIEYTRHPAISFRLFDDLSGLDPASVAVALNGISFSSACFDYIDEGGGYYSFTMDTLCYEYFGCDTITVSVTATDSTDYCADNELDTSWTFSIDCEGPHGEEIYVPPMLTSSCEGDTIVIYLWDIEPGVDPATISISVTGYGTISYPDPDLWYHDDTLVFYPTPSFPDEGIITVTLVTAEDFLGNPLEEPLSWDFLIDRIAPLALDWSPACGETIANSHPDISIEPYDSGCGVVLDSSIVTVNGTDYTYASGDIVELDDRLVFDPDLYGLRFPGGEPVSVCWHLVDCADDICPPNTVDTCCTFYVESGGPWSEISGPCEGDWIGCEAETVHISFEDEDGMFADSIMFQVCFGPACDDCDTLDITATDIINYFEFHDSIVFDYVITLPPDDGWQVCVHTIYAVDSLGNNIFDFGNIDTFEVMLDFSAPIVVMYEPPANDTIPTGAPIINVEISDTYSGIDDGTVFLIIEDDTVSTGDPGFNWDTVAGIASYDAATAGIWWVGGTVVDVCIHAGDLNCACPNELDSCWSFVIAPGGPVAEVMHPAALIVSACEGESVVVALTDPQGDNIIDASIAVTIWRSSTVDTVTLMVEGDPQFIWDEPSNRLTMYPAPALMDAETLYLCVVAADDTLGNPLEETVCIQFSMDLSAFEAHSFTPADDETVSTRSPDISLVAIDRITGIADSSVVMTVDGIEYTLDDAALYWLDDSTLFFEPESAGVFWTGGDCFEVTFEAYDQPTEGYCEPNDSSVTWTVCVMPGGPVGVIERPFSGAFSSCIDEHIVMTITDEDGVDSSTIKLVVEGDEFTIADSELEFINDTLYYYPATPFVDAQIVLVCLVEADDKLGNELSDTVCWSFTMDFSPPWTNILEPTEEMVRDREQDIVISVGDEISGVDSTTVTIWVNGERFEFGEFLWSQVDSTQGGIVRFRPESFDLIFPPGEEVCVEINLTDSTDYCTDNEFDTTYCFMIEPEVSCLVHPNPFTPNNDGVNEFAVFDYPYMFTENAELQIFDMRNIMVYHRDIENINDVTEFFKRNWNGCDDNNQPLSEGLYIWLIVTNGEIVCNGTVVLAR